MKRKYVVQMVLRPNVTGLDYDAAARGDTYRQQSAGWQVLTKAGKKSGPCKPENDTSEQRRATLKMLEELKAANGLKTARYPGEPENG